MLMNFKAHIVMNSVIKLFTDEYMQKNFGIQLRAPSTYPLFHLIKKMDVISTCTSMEVL